jgi:hypothetical protein
VSCAFGLYSDTYNAYSCQQCPPESYSNLPRSTACIPCPPGQTSTNGLGAACQRAQPACSPGTFFVRGSSCEGCPRGSYSDRRESFATSYIPCPSGTYMSYDSQTGCYPCQAAVGLSSVKCRPSPDVRTPIVTQAPRPPVASPSPTPLASKQPVASPSPTPLAPIRPPNQSAFTPDRQPSGLILARQWLQVTERRMMALGMLGKKSSPLPEKNICWNHLLHLAWRC